VTAIDPSDDPLAYARTRPGVRMTDFQVGDAQKLPFAAQGWRARGVTAETHCDQTRPAFKAKGMEPG